MSNITTQIKNWSATAASNQPDGTDAATIVGDLQAIQAGVRNLYSQDTIASATTCDLGTKDAESLTISGTTTIAGLGTLSAGIVKRVVFSGALTLTYNATSLILPTSANITTAAGDTAEFESLGAGNWRCNRYTLRSGAAPYVAVTAASDVTYAGSTNLVASNVEAALDELDSEKAGLALANTFSGANTFTKLQTFAAGANIASASTVDLTSATGNTVVITGTTTITAFTMTAGQQMTLVAGGAFQLTYHATTMKLNSGGANIVCSVGDVLLVSKSLDNVINVRIVRQDGTAVIGGSSTFAATIGVGNAIPSVSGAGITFPATQSASTDPNTLDDYEEGTWVPALVYGTVNGTPSGKYVKIGSCVFYEGVLSVATQTNGNDFGITNFPFVSVGISSAAGYSDESTLQWLDGEYSTGILYGHTSAGLNITVTAMSGNLVRFSGHYQV